MSCSTRAGSTCSTPSVRIQIGISLDGDAQGNAWRVGYDGKPVYPRVAASLDLLAERGRSVGVIAAVTAAVLGRAEEVLDHLAGFGSVNAISFVPCFDSTIRRSTALPGRRRTTSRLLQQAAVNGTGGPTWAVHPDEYAQFVLAATAHWITAGHFARVKLEPAVSTIRRLRGLQTGFCHSPISSATTSSPSTPMAASAAATNCLGPRPTWYSSKQPTASTR